MKTIAPWYRLALIPIVGLATWLFLLALDSPEQRAEEAGLRAAKALVMEQMDSPSAARFSPPDETHIVITRDVCTVWGWVELPHSPSESVRMYYNLSMTYDDSEHKWAKSRLSLTPH